MTMRQLARLADVSVSAVSKAFSGSSDISREKREHIFEVAKKAGCFDKYYKGKFEKYVIAVITPEFQSGYYARQLTLFEKEIKKHGGITIAGSSNFESSSKAEIISFFAKVAKVDGIVIYGDVPEVYEWNVPIVIINDQNESVLDGVSLSFRNAIKASVEHFMENGHTNIAFIGEKHTRAKANQFKEVMREKGAIADEKYIVESIERFEKAGYDAMGSLLELQNPPTAVLAAYDSIAIGAMKRIYESGLKIPDDISLIGMDDIRETPYLNVGLTSITSYCEDLCEVVIDLLFAKIEKGSCGIVKKVNVSTELIKRGSVGKVKE